MKKSYMIIASVLFVVLLVCGFYVQAGIKTHWKPCTGLSPIKAAITTDGTHFTSTFKATPNNAPCYIDVTATATDETGTVKVSNPIRIYIKK